MATIFDIAKRAGVSITTVSRALNGYSDVGEKTRQRVIEIAREMNYYPSAAARSLQVRRMNTIAFAPQLLQHAESAPFFKEFVGLLALSCFKHDLSLLALVTESPEDTEEVFREVVGSGRVDGIILADLKPHDERIDLLQELNVPFVAFGRTLDYATRSYPFVDVDGATGMRAVVAHLHAQGHRRIAYLSSPFNTFYTVERYNGYSTGLAAHGLTEDERLVIHELQPEEVEEAVGRLLALDPAERPTAIATSNDRLAIGVLSCLGDRDIPIGSRPGHIAVTGFDDLSMAEFLRPPLTTVRQPINDACEMLLNLLIARMRNKEMVDPVDAAQEIVRVGPDQILLQPELVVRGSA